MFAERLKGLRKKAGYTVSEFASEIYMDTRSILKWEKGLSVPEFFMLGLICEKLHCSLEELLGVKTSKRTFFGTFNKKTFRKTLKQLRKKKRVSYEEIAEHVGVIPDVVVRWEKGKKYPDMRRLVLLANYFAVSPSRIYFGEADGDLAVVFKNKRRSRFALFAMGIACLLALIVFIVFMLPIILTMGNI